MLFNKIKISMYSIFFIILICSLSYNKYQHDKIESYKAEVSTLRTTLDNVKAINTSNELINKKYNELFINIQSNEDPNNVQKNIDLFNNISNSMFLSNTRGVQ